MTQPPFPVARRLPASAPARLDEACAIDLDLLLTSAVASIPVPLTPVPTGPESPT